MSTGISVHASIDVPDLEAGLRFYRSVFGFTEKARPFPTMAIIDAGNLTLCIHERPEGSLPAPDSETNRAYGRHWTPVHLDIHVPALDPIIDLIRQEGGRIEREMRNMGPKLVAFCSDPFGHGFCVIADG